MVAPAPVPARSISRVLPPSPVGAAVTMLAFTALLYVIEAVDQITGDDLQRDGGIVSRNVEGLWGILWAPLLHGSWAHLLGNTVPFLVFGFLAMAGGIRQWVAVTALIWAISGLGVWLFGAAGYTVGASGVIFGWLVFLLARGFLARSLRQIGLAVGLFAVWGSVLVGILPGQPGISWQAHLFGALGGLLAASVVARADGRSRPVAPVAP